MRLTLFARHLTVFQRALTITRGGAMELLRGHQTANRSYFNSAGLATSHSILTSNRVISTSTRLWTISNGDTPVGVKTFYTDEEISESREVFYQRLRDLEDAVVELEATMEFDDPHAESLPVSYRLVYLTSKDEKARVKIYKLACQALENLGLFRQILHQDYDDNINKSNTKIFAEKMIWRHGFWLARAKGYEGFLHEQLARTGGLQSIIKDFFSDEEKELEIEDECVQKEYEHAKKLFTEYVPVALAKTNDIENFEREAKARGFETDYYTNLKNFVKEHVVKD